MERIAAPGKLANTACPAQAPPPSSRGAALPGADSLGGSALADLLRASAPKRAYGFALAMHERSCESGDEHWRDLWRSAVEILQACRERREADQEPQRTAGHADAMEGANGLAPGTVQRHP